MKDSVPSAKLMPGDIVICVLIAAVAVLILLFQMFMPSDAQCVEISSDQGTTTYPLSVDREITVKSNAHSLTVIIKDGEAYVISSDCPDHVCVNTGKISRAGESVICVPARVAIRVSGDSEVDYALR